MGFSQNPDSSSSLKAMKYLLCTIGRNFSIFQLFFRIMRFQGQKGKNENLAPRFRGGEKREGLKGMKKVDIIGTQSKSLK